ncbi:MAG: aminoglycoside phosphotransferase family protein [Lachnospiraceae bacterium]|nr:aminoglycoside phosphotransferase family protein [Lachnospiraceae bacterium]
MPIEELCAEFDIHGIVRTRTAEGGHINVTRIIDAESGRYVLQRLHPKMDVSKLARNYSLYSGVCDRHGWLYPVWLAGREGSCFVRDSEGFFWRMYPFLEGEIREAPLSGKLLYSCGQGLAVMHAIFAEMPAEPEAVYPGLHDTAKYYREYRQILDGEEVCGELRDAGLEELIEKRMEKLPDATAEKCSVVHGDTKLSNILFRNGKVAGCLDLDTIMKGSICEDIADCLRSCCVRGAGPEAAVSECLIAGYADASGQITEAELKERVPAVFDRICFELGLRYYADAISGGKRFGERYPGYRMERARQLLIRERR